ncbi:MAG TPA: hypothetical protein VFA66_07190 [Gaiellaceae bacterium]|nr:hypothetical protein [Gaiellaceae bacterium]
MAQFRARSQREEAGSSAFGWCVVFAVLLTVVVVMVYVPRRAWSGTADRTGGSTFVFKQGGKAVGELSTDGSVLVEGGLIGYWSFRPHGIVYFQEDYCANDCQYGYARMRAGEFWYVEAFFAESPHVRTIGTVRKRTSRIWDAYRGLGAHARRIGWATGSYPGVGAVALLVMPCWCPP